MKKQLFIIGGGFAGFWAAISALRQGRTIHKSGEIDITLVNPDNIVTMRPKLNELPSEGLTFDLDKYLKPLGVHQITGRAERIDPEKNGVLVSTAQGVRDLHYDYLILAAGASLKVPNLPGISHTYHVDTFDNARRLEDHIIDLVKKDFQEEGATTFVVVGSDFTGLQTVAGIEQKIRTLQAYHSGKKSVFRIILLERDNRFASRFSNECKQYIQGIVSSKKIEVLSNRALMTIGPSMLLLSDGTRIPARTVIWTAGLAASPLTQFFTGTKDDINRLTVDRFLKLPGYNNVIAAGNVAHTSGDNAYSSLMDCQYAQFEGRWAGHNAVNDLFDSPLKEYVQPRQVPCLDLGEPQTSYVPDWEGTLQMERYKVRAAEAHMNMVTMYPWQDVEATVKASYPEIPVSNFK